MRAIVFDPARGVSVEERPRPVPGPGEVAVEVRLAGVCATDLELAKGYMGFAGIPGHEFVGMVEGRAVVGEINAACGRCEACAGSLERHCPLRTVLGILGRSGAFAEYLTLPAKNLHAVPEGLPLERALFTEPVAAAFEILEQVPVRGRRTLVLGAGKLGSLSAWVLRRAGAAVTILARRMESLARFDAAGFPTILASKAPRAPAHRERFDIVVDATGSADGFPLALVWVRPRGTIVLKTTVAHGRPLDLAPVVIDEVTVVGSRCGPFAPAIQALVAGDLVPETMIGGRYRLDEAVRCLAAAARPEDPERPKMIFEIP